MTTSAVGAINIGNRNLNPPPADWTPFDWVDPKYGPQTKGEVVVIRPEGASGSLMSGLWRTGHEIAGCESDGSCIVDYSAPLGDETMVILEGSAVITEVATGVTHEIAAGTILSHPKNVDLHWEIREPFLKNLDRPLYRAPRRRDHADPRGPRPPARRGDRAGVGHPGGRRGLSAQRSAGPLDLARSVVKKFFVITKEAAPTS